MLKHRHPPPTHTTKEKGGKSRSPRPNYTIIISPWQHNRSHPTVIFKTLTFATQNQTGSHPGPSPILPSLPVTSPSDISVRLEYPCLSCDDKGQRSVHLLFSPSPAPPPPPLVVANHPSSVVAKLCLVVVAGDRRPAMRLNSPPLFLLLSDGQARRLEFFLVLIVVLALSLLSLTLRGKQHERAGNKLIQRGRGGGGEATVRVEKRKKDKGRGAL